MITRVRHPRRVRNLAFKIWRNNERNLKKTATILAAEHDTKVQVSTIMRWRDAEDWEAKYLLVENQVKKLLRSSDDPVLREMAMDDSLIMRFLGILTRLLEDSLAKKSNRVKFMPRNSAELMRMIDFITTQQSRILGNEDARRATEPPPVANLTYNDNRKVILRDRLGALPKDQQRVIIEQMRGSVDKKALATVREQAWAEEEAEEG